MTAIYDVEEIDDDGIPAARKRRGDGGVYLIVADETAESEIALRYAARMAASNRGHLAILHVAEAQDFQHWGGVESIMKQELRDLAEKFVWSVAKKVNDLNGLIPSVYIAEGERSEIMVQIINQDQEIKMLVLGGSAAASGPGPLVAYFTGKGMTRLRVPVLVVPGQIDPVKIDSLV